MNLGTEVDLIVYDHNGKVVLCRDEPARREERFFAEVKVFHDDSIVNMAHLVNIIETNLYGERKHGL